jgi:lauroyl/myristoyl acyltransferase
MRTIRGLLSPRRGGARGLMLRFGAGLSSHAGRPDLALKALQKLQHVTPEDADVQYNLGKFYVQSGDDAGRETALRKMLALRRRLLPATLADGFAQLRAHAGEPINEAALEWAWRNLAPNGTDRIAWEKAARFGPASDKLIWDWSHCAPERASEMDALIDFNDRAIFERMLARNRGTVIIGAYVGVLNAAPYLFRGHAGRIKALGAQPRSVALDNIDRYINSESPHSLRHVMRALDAGCSVAIVADRSLSENVLTAPFPGGTLLKVHRWIPKMIWKHRFDYLYLSPIWRDGRIRLVFDESGPKPGPDESLEIFEQRFMAHFTQTLLALYRSGPENLNMSGGFWRDF